MGKNFFRTTSAFICIFFIVMLLLMAFFIVPVINKTLHRQHAADMQITLETEAELFKRFIGKYRVILEDFSTFPVVTNAVLLSSADDPDFVDLVENFSIDGKKDRFTFHNIAGEVIYQGGQKQRNGMHYEFPWLQDIIDGKRPYNFQLLGQDGKVLNFVISIPVYYLDHIEGVLSLEVSAPILEIFSHQNRSFNAAFKVTQGNVVAQTDMIGIVEPYEVSTELVDEKLELALISDSSAMISEQAKLRNTVLISLLLGGGVSFFLFVVLGYKALMRSTEEKEAIHSLPRGAYVLPVIVALFGFTVSVLVSQLVFSMVEQQHQKDILAKNRLDVLLLQQNINEQLNVLSSLKAFYDSSEFVSRNEFRMFTETALDEKPMIKALGWMPEIIANAESSYIKKAIQDGLSDYQITKQNHGNNEDSLGVSYPVYYVEPQNENKTLLGVDLSSNVNVLPSLREAMKHRKTVITPPLSKILGDRSDTASFLMFSPVYNDRLGVLEGFLMSSLDIRKLINYSVDGKHIFLQDVTHPKQIKTVFGEALDEGLSEYQSTAVLDVGMRKWRIEIAPNDLSVDKVNSLLYWVVLIVGSSLSLFISYNFIQLIRQRRIVEKTVQERTSEIEDAKHFQDLIMSHIPDFVFVKDEKFRIVNANPAFLSAYPEEMRSSVIGTTTIESYPADEAEAFLHFDKVALSEGVSKTEETVTFPDGKKRTLLTKKVRFFNKEGNAFVLGVGRDITAEKEAEDALHQANEELEEFAYRTSHDLRSPLLSSIGLLNIARKSFEENKIDQMTKSLDLIEQSLVKLEKLVKDILSLTQAKNASEDDVELNVHSMVEEAIQKLAHMDNFDRLIINYNFEFLGKLKTKKSRITLIIENLLSNAIKYQDTNETNSYIKISTTSEKGAFILKIEDNGLGIPKEHQSSLFEMFKRFHNKVSFGSGLGLYMIKKSAEILGGELIFEDPGKGTIFKLVIPIKE